MRRVFLTVWFAALLGASVPAQQFVPAPGADPLHRPFDQILDSNVRDGMVYYRALAASRGALDRYIASLNVPGATYDTWSKPQQMAFWVNAYNAFVLQTVVSHYPLHGTVRSIPGAFDKTAWHAAGRSVTLDQIEKTILPDFKEPRLFLALGRGCIGGGRLRSEAYTAERLDKQLADIQTEFVTNGHMYKLDRVTNTLSVTPIFSWREADFVAAYDAKDPVFATRSPIERAVVAFVTPHLLPSEKEFIQKNDWKMSFLEMDWKLNDLSGR
jgi:hypothetical protein